MRIVPQTVKRIIIEILRVKGLKLDFSVLIIRKYTGFSCKNNCFLGVNVIQNKDVKGTKNYIHTTISTRKFHSYFTVALNITMNFTHSTHI